MEKFFEFMYSIFICIVFIDLQFILNTDIPNNNFLMTEMYEYYININVPTSLISYDKELFNIIRR